MSKAVQKLEAKIAYLANLTASSDPSPTSISYRFCIGRPVYYMHKGKYYKRKVVSRRYYRGKIFYLLDDNNELSESSLMTLNELKGRI